ncbi:MAG TPA: signal peptidase I [Polyangia bacterium]|nr:signal peptidase I [Polyangia bacterium]
MTVVVPIVLSLLVLRFVLPSRLEGAGGGALGFFAWLGDAHPLFVGVALFLALSEIARYWLRLARGGDPAAESARPWAGVHDRGRRLRLLIGLAALFVAIFFLRTSVVATFRIVGPSMLPTLELGDRVLTNRLAYGLALPFRKTLAFRKTPRRGDMVVFRANGLAGPDGPQSLVKRVIGVPGDRVSFEQGSLFINDWRVPTCDAGPYVDLAGPVTVRGRLTVEYLGDHSYLTVRKPIETPFPGYVVKPGEVFVVGDDRGLSSDSRLWNEGRGAGVAIDVLEGRVSRVLFGARPDGRLDFSRVLAPPLDLKVRLPGLDLRKTDERIANCLARRPAQTVPPAGRYPSI